MPEPLPIVPTVQGEQMMPGQGGPGMMPGYPGMMAGPGGPGMMSGPGGPGMVPGPNGPGMMPGYSGMGPDQGYGSGPVEGGIGPKDPQSRWYGSLGYQALNARPCLPRPGHIWTRLLEASIRARPFLPAQSLSMPTTSSRISAAASRRCSATSPQHGL